MTTLRLSAFRSALPSGIVLVDFWAPWCAPSRAYLPVYEAASERHPGVTFATVDVESDPQLASALHVGTIPTLIAFRDHILVFVHPGFLLGDALDLLVRDLRRLNMSDVRRKRTAFAV